MKVFSVLLIILLAGYNAVAGHDSGIGNGSDLHGCDVHRARPLVDLRTRVEG